MKTLFNILFVALIFGILHTTSAHAQSEQVRFAVNMEYANLDPGDQVVVRGNRARLGNWQAEGELLLSPAANNPSIYRGNVRLNRSGEVLYKYVIKKADGTEIWEETGNRVLSSEQSTPDWFSDRSSPGISKTFVEVTFTLDLTQHTMDGFPAEGVALMGMHAPLGFDLETQRTEMTEVSQGIWQTTVYFPFGTPHDVPFKFAWYHEGEWRWEWKPGHTNHVFWIDDSSAGQSVSLAYDAQVPGVVAAEGSSGHVDEYAYIIQQLGERASRSRYGYALAIKRLKAGDRQGAEAAYQQYRAGHPGGEEIDDFDYEMAYHIQRKEGETAAQEFVEQKLATETTPERRSYLRYLRGELAMHAGDQKRARRLLKQALEQSDWELVGEYSRRALVQSYLQESSTDSVQRGVQLLRQFAANASPENRREYAVQLARAYQRAGMAEEQEEILNELATRGNARQQVKGKLQLANWYLQQRRYTEALGLMDAIEFGEALPARLELQLTRQRIRAYYQLDMYDELSASYQRYRTTWPEDAYRPRLQYLFEQASEKMGIGTFVEPTIEPATADSTQN